MTPLSGTQFSLASGEYRAEIASVGATLRTLRRGERDLILPFDADELRPRYLGAAALFPWPNRVVDGRYTFEGEERQLAITEPERGHALHGLASWLDYTATEQSADAVTLEATVEPQQGYPHRITTLVRFALGPDGLTCTVSATNAGPSRAPFGTATHTYLVGGPGTADDWTLTLPTSRVLEVDERLSPIREVDVPAELDFRQARSVGGTQMDHAFTGLARGGDGLAEVRLLAGDGHGVSLTWGEEYPWVQAFTADVPDLARGGIAVEPMTCAPDAFNTGTGLIVLEPGESFSGSWTLTAV
ncbi:aldose 1-epimerase family protein [Naasia sp. SYSU D00057]|uniref:aldose 1-epimerase family protein n=1 Tax=Naasia sp. SYSU D00057 TaxID=2817380 RepID=UPI0027DB1D2C|nr:aldose 1-epimerase family protein [Naasia sp. SYSU D00057]